MCRQRAKVSVPCLHETQTWMLHEGREVTENLKRAGMLLLCMLWLAAVSGCGSEKDWVFDLNGESIDSTEVAVFGLIFTEEYKITDAGQLLKYHVDGETYADFYKDQLEQEIIKAALLYREAELSGHKLTREEKDAVRSQAQALFDHYGKDWLKKRGISLSDIEDVVEMRVLGDSYLESLAEGDRKEEEEPDSREPDRYLRVYQVTFPVVSLDADGMVQSDADGSLIKLPEEDCAQMKELAEFYAERVREDTGMEDALKTLAADYAGTGQDEEGTDLSGLCRNVRGVEKYLKYQDLDDAWSRELDSLKPEETSSVLEADYGYVVLKLLDADAREQGQILAEHTKQVATQDTSSRLLDKLVATYVREDQNYRNDELWSPVLVSAFMK